MSKFTEYLEVVTKSKEKNYKHDYDRLLNFLTKELNKKYKLNLTPWEEFDIKDLQLRWNFKTGLNYQEVVSDISKYTKEELLKIVVTFLKKKGKIK